MSIRLRLAAVFTVAAAALFALGAWILAAKLADSLLAQIDAQLTAQVGSASRYLTAGGGPALAPPGNPALDETLVQVIDSSGRVRAGSQDPEGAPLLPPSAIRRARHRQIALTFPAEEGGKQRVVAGPLIAKPARPGWIAVAALPLDSYDATLSDQRLNLIVGAAIFVAVAGLGAYGLARAALSPVERLRREVASLSERDQGRGVRVPRTRDELAALAETMNDLLGRLQRALARQRGLVADASHELRTPLAVLRGELELAGRPGRTQAELAGAVTRASEEAARLGRITDQLLLLARSDEDRLAPSREPTDVAALLARCAGQAAARAAAAGVSCQVDVPAGLTAAVDPVRLREAVENLVDNALRFAPAGSAIRLMASPDGADLTVEVRDTGPGFPADFLPHAFERFRRPDSGRASAAGGAGLGLAIVSAIARAHGGRAVARNQPGGGAAVSLWLPGAVITGDGGPAVPSQPVRACRRPGN